MTKKKCAYYVVWQGLQPGVYTDWDTCEAQVKGQKGAIYKGFATKEEAEKALCLHRKYMCSVSLQVASNLYLV